MQTWKILCVMPVKIAKSEGWIKNNAKGAERKLEYEHHVPEVLIRTISRYCSFTGLNDVA